MRHGRGVCMYRLNRFSDSHSTISVHTQDRRRHSLCIEPLTQLEIRDKEPGSNRREVYPGIDSALVGQYAFTIAQRQHTNGHTIFQDHLLVDTWLRISDNL